MLYKYHMTAQPNASLITGLSCLQTLMLAGEALGSRELARRAGIVHTRCNRLLGTLAQLGLVEQDEQRKYRIGPALHVWSAQTMQASRLVPAAMPELARWHAEGFTVALGVVWQGLTCFLVHARPGQALHESLGRHELIPADRSACGLVLLSHHETVPELPAASHGELAPGEDDLAAALARTRADGFARRRFANGETSLGVAIGRRPVAAIAISHRHLDEGAVPELARRLGASAQRIEAALGTVARTR